MDTSTPPTTDNWTALLDSWDKQQTAYIAFREDRFNVMIQALGDHVGTSFTFVDLGCGPGSLTQRILDAFPLAKAIALDTGHLHQPADWVAGEPEIMLHADFRGIFDLCVGAAERSGKTSSSH